MLLSSFICSSTRLDPVWLTFRGHRPVGPLPLNRSLVDLSCLAIAQREQIGSARHLRQTVLPYCAGLLKHWPSARWLKIPHGWRWEHCQRCFELHSRQAPSSRVDGVSTLRRSHGPIWLSRDVLWCRAQWRCHPATLPPYWMSPRRWFSCLYPPEGYTFSTYPCFWLWVPRLAQPLDYPPSLFKEVN